MTGTADHEYTDCTHDDNIHEHCINSISGRTTMTNIGTRQTCTCAVYMYFMTCTCTLQGLLINMATHNNRSGRIWYTLYTVVNRHLESRLCDASEMWLANVRQLSNCFVLRQISLQFRLGQQQGLISCNLTDAKVV